MSAASAVPHSFRFGGSFTGIFMAPECREAVSLINTICLLRAPLRRVGQANYTPLGSNQQPSVP